MKKLIQSLIVLCFLACVFFLQGCETPQGGSSIPWGKPEPWEGETPLIGIPTN